VRLLVAIDTWGLIGGTERYARTVVPALRDRGHDVHILCAEALESACPGVDLIVAPESRGEQLNSAERARLRNRLGALELDVVYALTARNRGAFEVLLERAPLVRYVQDHTLFCPGQNKFLESGEPCTRPLGLACLQSYFLGSGCTGYKPTLFERKLKSPLARLRAKERELALHRRAAHLLTNSEYMRGELLQVGFTPERVSHLPYFTSSNTSAEPPGELPEETREFVENGADPLLVTPARLTLPDKGVDYLLTALGKLRKPFRAVVAGSGPAEEWLRTKARDEGLASRVHFAGWLAPDAIETLYARARAVIVPSIWNEPFGLVGLEAMAHGRAVAAFAVGGIPEWLEHERTGYLVPRKDTTALAACIDRLLADPGLAERLGAEGRRRALERFTAAEHFARLEDVLAGVSRSTEP